MCGRVATIVVCTETHFKYNALCAAQWVVRGAAHSAAAAVFATFCYDNWRGCAHSIIIAVHCAALRLCALSSVSVQQTQLTDDPATVGDNVDYVIN